MIPGGGTFNSFHSSTKDMSEPWQFRAMGHFCAIEYSLRPLTSEIWPKPKICHRKNKTPCTKTNLNASLPTTVLGMKQETDLFEQSSISICNHTTVCCDSINSHKVALGGWLPPSSVHMQPPRNIWDGNLEATGGSHLLSQKGFRDWRLSFPQSKTMVPDTLWKATTSFKIEGRNQICSPPRVEQIKQFIH